MEISFNTFQCHQYLGSLLLKMLLNCTPNSFLFDSKLFRWSEMLMKQDLIRDINGMDSSVSYSFSTVMILMWTVMLQNSKNLTFQMHYKLCCKSWKIALQKQRLLLSEMYLFLFHILFRETISHSLKIINCCFHKFSLRCSGATENKPLFPVN